MKMQFVNGAFYITEAGKIKFVVFSFSEAVEIVTAGSREKGA